MLLFIIGPRSFTGEDVAELHIHSSKAVISALYRHLGSMEGLRLAEAGEFTRRAFMNDKLNLAQVEGLADLISAESDSQRRLALSQVTGDLGKQFEGWRQKIITSMAMIEAWIDFSEDELIESGTLSKVKSSIVKLKDSMELQLKRQKVGELVKNGFRITLCGPPNAGKSSILNMLARRDVAIVSPIAGTTRDVLQVNMEVAGHSVIINDTAGLRSASKDIIEVEGMKRAIETSKASDHILFVLDGVEACNSKDPSNWIDQLKLLDPSKVDIILNKVDLLLAPSVESLRELLPVKFRNVGIFQNSCLPESTSSSLLFIEIFSEFIKGKLKDFQVADTLPIIMNERQRIQADIALKYLNDFLNIYSKDIVIGAEYLRQAASAIGRISGHVDTEEILDTLFSTFCIGK